MMSPVAWLLLPHHLPQGQHLHLLFAALSGAQLLFIMLRPCWAAPMQRCSLVVVHPVTTLLDRPSACRGCPDCRLNRASWHTQGLLSSPAAGPARTSRGGRKLVELGRLLSHHTVVLQEVRGGSGLVPKLRRLTQSPHHLLASGLQHRAGGVVILLDKVRAHGAANHYHVRVPGRAHSCLLRIGQQSCCCVNLHVFAGPISSDCSVMLMQRLHSWVLAHPGVLTCVRADWNVVESGDFRLVKQNMARPADIGQSAVRRALFVQPVCCSSPSLRWVDC